MVAGCVNTGYELREGARKDLGGRGGVFLTATAADLIGFFFFFFPARCTWIVGGFGSIHTRTPSFLAVVKH